MSPGPRKIVQLVIWSLLVCSVTPVRAQIEPDRSNGVGQKEFRLGDLEVNNVSRFPRDLPAQVASGAASELAALGLSVDSGRYDLRGERWETLILSEPLLPGTGKGNNLRWPDGPPRNEGALRQAAWDALNGYFSGRQAILRIDESELTRPGKVTVYGDGSKIQIHASRRVDGIPVRGTYLSAVLSHGNLVLLGTHLWGNVNVSTQPRLSEEEALAVVEAYAEPYALTGTWGKTELMIVPLARGQGLPEIAAGQGYAHRLAWAVRVSVNGDLGSWEGLVDAHSGELLSFEDTNHYVATARRVQGGVLPVSNDGVAPDGVEQAGWPMPFERVTTPGGTVTTDAGGNLPGPVDGNISSSLSGQYIRMNDNCGAISLTSAGDIDFGTSGGTDCVTPGFGGAGNTHASRTGFHELNRIKEMGRGQLPGNIWLQQQLTSNMNINSTCNAFWNGVTVNFYRSGGGCANTGELAGVFDHEWGHGMDANDATPGVSNPGEGIADIYTALRLNDSCIGRNFRPGVPCGGYGDPCLTCTGVRDIDYHNRVSGQPHDFTWANANCGGGVHCRGYVYSEAVWDLWKRDLAAAPYNMDNNTALEVVTRLTYIGAGGVGTWYSGSPPFGGCSASGGYLNYLAADDDNGDLADGTPHMTAIFNAFDRHEIACNTPAVADSGCAGMPTVAPSVLATPLDKSASLSWNAVAGATRYQVFRTDGVFPCHFGKVKIGETAGTIFNDSGLQNGRQYSYVVIPIGASDSCMGPASSCATAMPADGPNLDVDAASAVLSIDTGDSDEFLDNCEQGQMTFNVANTGLGALTNVRIVGVTPVSHPDTSVLTTFPALISPSTLAMGETGFGGFDFIAEGLVFNDTLVFEVEVTADEMTVSRFENLTVGATESDFVTYASRTYSFEGDYEEWLVAQGTFNRSSALGGGDGTTWAVASSDGLHNRCDRIRSPLMRLQATSTLSLWNNYDIEPMSSATWYDRANVGIIDEFGARTLVTPDSGRLYNADSSGPGSYSGCNDPEEGWAGLADSWAPSNWSAAALQSSLFAGEPIQMEIIYATDPALANRGFSFDEVTVTDVEFQEADGQGDVCSIPCTVDPDCDDGLFCNGAETCDTGSGFCQAGTPVNCNDSVGCTVDACNEGTDGCDNLPDDALCGNGDFCDGAETCDALAGCQAGTLVNCDDTVGCTVDSCNESTDSCDNTPDDTMCDDGVFCNGAEVCDPALDCQAGTAPCQGGTCDEAGGVCLGCGDGVCDAGEDCDSCPADCIRGTTSGATCGNGICEAGDGEDCLTCPADCNGVQNGRPGGRFCCGNGGQNPVDCGDSRCTTGGFQCTEDPQTPVPYCCGDAVCQGAEDVSNCAVDCDTCGDGVCDPEDRCSCASDCGAPPDSEAPGLCSDGIDNDCDIVIDCADFDCAGDPACQPADCSLFTSKQACNAQATCNWDNRNKVCLPN